MWNSTTYEEDEVNLMESRESGKVDEKTSWKTDRMFAAIFVMRFFPTLRVAVMCEDPENHC